MKKDSPSILAGKMPFDFTGGWRMCQAQAEIISVLLEVGLPA